MKTIVFAIDSNSAGGAERVISTLANYFSNTDKYNVIVINSYDSDHFYTFNSNIILINLHLDTLSNKSSIYRFIIKIIKLKNIFKDKEVDVAVAFLFRMEAPAIIAGFLSHTKVFTSVRNSALSYKKSERLFRRLIYPYIGGVVFQSDAVRLYKDYKKLNNATVISNPLPVEMKKEVPIEYNNRKNWIIGVGRLNEQKNFSLLINAFIQIAHQFPELELHIFGEGRERFKLQEIISNSEFSNRIFLDGVLEDAIYKNRDSRAFVMSSDFEGFPNALVEAMAYGIPCISTDFDSGIAATLIQNGKNGYLCKVKDVNDMSEKMITLLKLGADTDKLSYEASKVYSLLNASSIGKKWEEFVFQS